tara:strand:+ start:176 stop:1072 length:897 start_codon:yes stop_codon:yes gene_type:complete
MSFDDLKPQSVRTSFNTREPNAANNYGEFVIAKSREAAKLTRNILDIPFGEDYYQKLDLYLPETNVCKDLPVLLYFHGGAWQHGYKEWNGFMAPAILEFPAIFVSASYRLAPDAKFPAPLEDAITSLQWVWENITSYGGDRNRIFTGGWSVGGTLAALVTLRHELYSSKGLPSQIVKACFAASAGYRYKYDVLAPGKSGQTYGDLMYNKVQDEVLAEPLHYVSGNKTPFYISWGSQDFNHVIQSSKDMVRALEDEGCTIISNVFEGFDHYQVNMEHGNSDNKWVKKVREWMVDPGFIV